MVQVVQEVVPDLSKGYDEGNSDFWLRRVLYWVVIWLVLHSFGLVALNNFRDLPQPKYHHIR